MVGSDLFSRCHCIISSYGGARGVIVPLSYLLVSGHDVKCASVLYKGVSGVKYRCHPLVTRVPAECTIVPLLFLRWFQWCYSASILLDGASDVNKGGTGLSHGVCEVNKGANVYFMVPVTQRKVTLAGYAVPGLSNCRCLASWTNLENVVKRQTDNIHHAGLGIQAWGL